MLFFATGVAEGFYKEPINFHHPVEADSKEEAIKKVNEHYKQKRYDVVEIDVFETIK